jgi:hypothetical protein
MAPLQLCPVCVHLAADHCFVRIAVLGASGQTYLAQGGMLSKSRLTINSITPRHITDPDLASNL